MPRLILLGVGTADSSRFAPAGLLVEYGRTHVGIDGGPGSEPPETVDAWLVGDELPHRDLVRTAQDAGMPAPALATFDHGSMHIQPLPLPNPAGPDTAGGMGREPSFGEWGLEGALYRM